MKKWLIIGIIIRLIIIPITFHPDTRFFILGNYLMVFKGAVFSLYDYLNVTGDPISQVISADAFTYPPLAFISNGLSAAVLYRFFSPDFVREVILNVYDQFDNLGFYLLLFVTKAPYIIADVLAGYYLAKVIGKKANTSNSSDPSTALRSARDDGALAFKLWMLNPITLYATFAIGQFDIFPTLATILAVWFILQKKNYHSAICLGIGGAYKLFPLLFLPFLVFGYGKNIKEKLLLLSTGGLAYLIPVLPYLSSQGFRQYALLAPQTDKMLFAKIPVSGAEYLSVFVVGYFLIFWMFTCFYNRDSSSTHELSQNDWDLLWKSMMAVLLLFFSVTHFHPQWFIWISPWLILLYLTNNQAKFSLSIILVSYFLIMLSFESSLNWGIFVWNQNASDLISHLPQFLRQEKFMYLSLIRSVFAGTAVWLVCVLRKTSQMS